MAGGGELLELSGHRKVAGKATRLRKYWKKMLSTGLSTHTKIFW